MINDILYFLDFTDVSEYNYSEMSNRDELMFSKIKFMDISKPKEFYESCDIAILGIPESRNSISEAVKEAPNKIREQLFKLYVPNNNIKIVDFGNIKEGKTVKDTYIAIQEVAHELLKNEFELIIIGGGKDTIVSICNIYKDKNTKFSLCISEPRFSLGETGGVYNEETYLSEIINNNKKLFNYSNIGYQTYYNSQTNINYIKNKFEAVRLGVARDKIQNCEPYIRDSDLFFIDMNSVKESEAPGVSKPSLHGFYGEEMCQLASFAGFNDKLSTFGVLSVNPNNDRNNKTSELSAQIIWHFIQGYYGRNGENSHSIVLTMEKYIVNIEEIDKAITFYKSLSTGRWWFEIPYKKKKKEGVKIISCTLEDFENASKNEIPERWWFFFRKLN